MPRRLLAFSLVFAFLAGPDRAIAEEERLPEWQGERSQGDKKPSSLGAAYSAADQQRGMWMELLSWRPRAYLVHHFMTLEEAAALVQIATPFMCARRRRVWSVLLADTAQGALHGG